MSVSLSIGTSLYIVYCLQLCQQVLAIKYSRHQLLLKVIYIMYTVYRVDQNK